MTRFEENEIIIDEVIKKEESKISGTYEEMLLLHISTIAVLLMDISRSLAILADKTESEDKDD